MGPLRPSPAMSEKELLDRLAALPRLSEALEGSRRPMGQLGAKELQSLFDKLERDLSGELERRALLEAQEFLALLLGGEGAGEAPVEGLPESARTAQRRPSQAGEVGGKGNLAGDQPGAKAGLSQPPPFRAGAAAHLQGLLGEGKSGALAWRAEAKAGESKVSEQDVTASYRRQAEAELASEKIPQGLKETVKKYFLSLGMTEEKK